MVRFDLPEPETEKSSVPSELSGLVARIDQLAAELREQKITVTAPEVVMPEIPAPVVHTTTQSVDMSPIEAVRAQVEAMQEKVVDALSQIVVNPEVNFPADDLVSGLNALQEAFKEYAEKQRVVKGGAVHDGRLRTKDRKLVSPDNPLPVTSAGGSGLTDDELRASDVAVTLDGESVAVTGTQTDALTDAELRATPVPVTLSSTDLRVEIAGLSFQETLGAFGSHATDWVEIDDHVWLDFSTDIESADAATALLEFTNADDPNTTPPGASDVVRPLSTTLAGSALGGVDDPSFGIPAQMRWIRLTVTDLTGGQDIGVSTYGQAQPPNNALLPVAATIDGNFRAALTKSVGVGENPAGDYQSLPIDGPVSRDSSVDSGTLVSGSLPAFDAVGPIVASNVIDTGWQDLDRWNYQSFRALVNVPGVKIFLMDAADDQGNNSVTTSFAVPTATTPLFGSVGVSAPFFQRYFRIVIINDTGTDATEWAYASKATAIAPGPINISIDQPLQDFFPAPVVRAVSVGRQPDGDYVNSPATGLATDVDGVGVETTSALGIAGVYQSGWTDTDGWDEIELVVAADQVSASDGILIEFTDDANATTPVARVSQTREFSAADVAAGQAVFRFAPALDGFRVTYTNGGVAQGSFYLGCVLRADNTSLPRGELEAVLNRTSEAVTVRSVLAGKDADGNYENVSTDGQGRLTVTSGSEFARLLNRQVEDTEELRLDVEPTSSHYYLGKAPDGTATSASSWDIVKISLSGSRNPERIQFVQNADWDNRATAF